MKFIDKQLDKTSKLLNVHAGHRKRFRKTLIESEMEDFSEHQILEYVLSVAIPRKDTNETAHLLLQEFGSFSNVLDAEIEDLKKVNGIGEISAMFLHTIPSIFKAYKVSKIKNRPNLSCPENVFRYVGRTFNHMPNEEFHLLCTDSLSNLIVNKLIASGTNNEVSFTLKSITESAMKVKAHGVILMHNHPNGETNPSAEDIEITKQIYLTLALNSINVMDHIIVGKDDSNYYSFARAGLLDLFKKDFEKLMGKRRVNDTPPPYEY